MTDILSIFQFVEDFVNFLISTYGMFSMNEARF